MDPVAAPSELMRRGTLNPAAFYVTGEDTIELAGYCISSGVRLVMGGRFLSLDGIEVPFVHELALTSNRLIATLVRSLGPGWIQNVTVQSSGNVVAYGYCYARVRILRGLTSIAVPLATLCAGNVTIQQPIAFPGGSIRSTHDGPGGLRSITGTDPAAGLEISETVPGGARWQLNALFASFVTDATVANRVPRLIIDDGTNTVFASDPPAAQTASLTIQYVTGAGIQRTAIGSLIPFWALPTDLVLLAGYRIRTATAAIVAGDNWGAPQLLVREWFEGDQ